MSPIIKPLGSRLLVRRLAPESTSGLIYIPNSAQELSQRVTVLVLGTGGFDEAGKPFHGFSVRPGDEVLIGKYVGTKVGADEDLLLILERDILGIFDVEVPLKALSGYQPFELSVEEIVTAIQAMETTDERHLVMRDLEHKHPELYEAVCAGLGWPLPVTA